MTTARRDLAEPDLWRRSLERSRHRRRLAPRARREQARRRHVSAALATAMLAGPGAPMGALASAGAERGAIAAESPATRAIEIKRGGLPLLVGSRGGLVAAVQRGLEIRVDGIFGPQTDLAVRRLQHAAGIRVDGIVGPVTWSALFAPGRAASWGASGGVGAGDVPPAVKRTVRRELEEAAGRAPAVTGERRADEERSRNRGADGGVVERRGGRGRRGADPERQTGRRERRADPDERGGDRGDGGRTTRRRATTTCGSSTLSVPVRGPVTSGFGPRWGRNHDGMDIAAPSGTPVRSVACGTVSLRGRQGGYGNIVCITHTSRFATCYAHLSRFAVPGGRAVRQGQTIGYVGCTGHCTGPHVHFETRVDGRPRDPSRYMAGVTMPGAKRRARSAAVATAVGGREPTPDGAGAKMPASTSGGAAAPGTGAAAPAGEPAVAPGAEAAPTGQPAAAPEPAGEPAAAPEDADAAPAEEPTVALETEPAPAEQPDASPGTAPGTSGEPAGTGTGAVGDADPAGSAPPVDGGASDAAADPADDPLAADGSTDDGESELVEADGSVPSGADEPEVSGGDRSDL